MNPSRCTAQPVTASLWPSGSQLSRAIRSKLWRWRREDHLFSLHGGVHHSFLRSFNSSVVAGGGMTPFIRSTMKWMVEAGIDPTEMQWFDISGTMDQSSVDQNWLHEYRPPFEKCMVVWQGHTKTHQAYEFLMTVVGTDPEDGIVLSVHKGPHGEMPRKLPLMVYAMDEGMVRYGPVDDSDVVGEEDANVILAVVANWYRLLAQGCSMYRPQVSQSFTNRRKIAEGKAPSYDWTTVYIEPSKRRSEGAVGTHASPRMHDRRGHLRRLSGGRNVWVKQCKVGDASLGTVWHDYSIRETA